MNISFNRAAEVDLPDLTSMVCALYLEDPSPRQTNAAHVRMTFGEFEKHPEKGQILLFEVVGEIAGYAILVHFWSNEYGGHKIVIDEIFVRPSFRGQGIAKAFFQHLETEYSLSAVVLELEATPDNTAARRLYESIGFRPAKNTYFNKLIHHANT